MNSVEFKPWEIQAYPRDAPTTRKSFGNMDECIPSAHIGVSGRL